jgi:hypothetical protein
MKARVKLTGEIVNIKDLYDDGTALVKDLMSIAKILLIIRV